MGSSPVVLDEHVLKEIDGETVLDLACGLGKWGFLMKTCWFCTASHTATGAYAPRALCGLDIFWPNVAWVREHKVYDHALQADACHLPFADNSFDVVLAVEIIEHIPRAAGSRLLAEAERVARKSVILTTPQYPGRREVESNPHERHVSRWKLKELKALGYHVRGIGFVFPHSDPDYDDGTLTPFYSRLFFALASLMRRSVGFGLAGALNFYLASFSAKFPQFATYFVARKAIS